MNRPKQSLRGLDKGQKAALIVSECQTAIVDPEISMFKGLAEEVRSRQVLPRIANLADEFRAANLPVIFCNVALLPEARAFKVCSPLHSIMSKNELLREGRAEIAVHPDIRPHPSDIICQRRHGVSAFNGTELEMILRNLDVETIVLTGVSTNIALLGTGIEAINRSFSIVLPEDCTAGLSPETHGHAIEHIFPIISTITSSEAVIHQLQLSKNPATVN